MPRDALYLLYLQTRVSAASQLLIGAAIVGHGQTAALAGEPRRSLRPRAS